MRTKLCSGACGRRLPNDEIHFAFKLKAHRLLRSECKNCYNKKKVEAYSRVSIDKHKVADQRSKIIIRNRTAMISYLEEHPCVDCGETDGIVLDFDHVRGEKYANISWMVRHCRSISKITDEIKKCDVVCANCHRRRTAKRAGWDTPYLEFNN